MDALERPLISGSLLLLIAFLITTKGFSQDNKVRKINYKADFVQYDKEVGKGAMRLLDNVRFEHEGVLMYCDSAYLYSESNSLEAYYNVHINQGDTLNLYGDYLEYDGDTKLAKVRSNVLLQNSETRLITNSLDYYKDDAYAYYGDGAVIYSSDNELKSRKGYYYSEPKSYLFQDSVVLLNPDYTMYADTLKFNTVSNTAYFLSPTDIISDTNTIYCERGWYNTETDISNLTKNNRLDNKEQTLWSDTLYYDRNTGIGEAQSNVTIYDKVQDVLLKGNYAYNDKAQDLAILTDSAMFVVIGEADSLYMHADSIRSFIDTADQRIVLAYYEVRIFKNDLQAVCDSLAYSFSDSTTRMYDNPVIWSAENQLTADYIEMLSDEGTVYQINMEANAFITSVEDSVSYNQIKGKDMVAHLSNNQLYRIDVNGNGQTVYYVKDEEDLIGMNYAESSNLIIYVVDKTIKRINFRNNPDAIMYPMSQTSEELRYLPGFRWLDALRPASKMDIYRSTKQTSDMPIPALGIDMSEAE